jgi:integrase
VLHPHIEDAWTDFRRSLARRGRSEHTVAIYRKSLESFWNWAADHDLPPDPGAITHRDINAWTSWMLEQPATRGGRIQYATDPLTGERTPQPIKPNTVRIRWANLRPFFAWWSTEMDEPNPFDRADAPRAEEVPIPVVTIDTIRTLLHAAREKTFEDRRDTALIRFLADTGARIGEVTSMTIDSWDKATDLVTLTGKTGTRLVPVSPATGEAMARYLRLRNRSPYAASPAFWLGLRGPLGGGGCAQMLYRRCDQAGVPRIHPHQLRHTWAHEMKTAGASEGDLMALGGWASTQMVHRYGKSAAAARAQDTARRIALGNRL